MIALLWAFAFYVVMNAISTHLVQQHYVSDAFLEGKELINHIMLYEVLLLWPDTAISITLTVAFVMVAFLNV